MNRANNVFAVLADRVEDGDSSAHTELRRELEPEMIHIVRRVIRSGAGHSCIDRRILAEARRIGLDSDAAEEKSDQLIRKVARCISGLFVEGLRARRAESFAEKETVCL